MSSYVFTNLDDPLGTRGTKANGINGAGQIVGSIRPKLHRLGRV